MATTPTPLHISFLSVLVEKGYRGQKRSRLAIQMNVEFSSIREAARFSKTKTGERFTVCPPASDVYDLELLASEQFNPEGVLTPQRRGEAQGTFLLIDGDENQSDVEAILELLSAYGRVPVDTFIVFPPDGYREFCTSKSMYVVLQSFSWKSNDAHTRRV